MRQTKRLVATIAGIALAAVPLAVLPANTGPAVAQPHAQSSGPALVPFTGEFRRCDHSNTTMPPSGNGTGYAVIGRSGNTVTAEVRLSIARPDTAYTVQLIQMPRTGVGCTPGDPGVAQVSMVADAGGNASTTVTAPVMSGATGAWVQVLGPFGGNTSRITGEVYSSDFIAKI